MSQQRVVICDEHRVFLFKGPRSGGLRLSMPCDCCDGWLCVIPSCHRMIIASGWDGTHIAVQLLLLLHAGPTPAGTPPGEAVNAELKIVDATSNPYLAITSLVAAGMLGLFLNLTLPPPLQVRPCVLFKCQTPIVALCCLQ